MHANALAALARLAPPGPPDAPLLHLLRQPHGSNHSPSRPAHEGSIPVLLASRPVALLDAARRLWPADLWLAPGIAVACASTSAKDPAAPRATKRDRPEMAAHADGPVGTVPLWPAQADPAQARLVYVLLLIDLPEGCTFLRRHSPSAHGRAEARASAACLPPLAAAALQGWAPPGLLLRRIRGRTLLLAQADSTHRWRLLGVR